MQILSTSTGRGAQISVNEPFQHPIKAFIPAGACSDVASDLLGVAITCLEAAGWNADDIRAIEDVAINLHRED